jgi:hypothetical protein
MRERDMDATVRLIRGAVWGGVVVWLYRAVTSLLSG